MQLSSIIAVWSPQIRQFFCNMLLLASIMGGVNMWKVFILVFFVSICCVQSYPQTMSWVVNH